jgi:tripartite-type tricarboxylate transporter receptor subunit TctC
MEYARHKGLAMSASRRQLLVRLAAPLVMPEVSVAAADYPSRAARVVVAGAPGGGDDFTARVLAEHLSVQLGQAFVVENRPGAGGAIGQLAVAKAPPDGYTLLLAGGSMAGARFVNAHASYDLMKDFTPISTIETSPYVLVVNPALPVKSLGEFIDHARARPGKLSYVTIGPGQAPFWAMLLFNRMAGIEAVEVPYKSGGDALTDVIAGRVDFFFIPLVAAIAAKDRVRILGVSTMARTSQLPDVPPITEAGLPGFDMPAWRSIMGPAGLERAVVATLNREILKALASHDLRDRFLKAGSTPLGSTPEELRQRFEDWTAIYGRIARDAKLKPQ